MTKMTTTTTEQTDAPQSFRVPTPTTVVFHLDSSLYCYSWRGRVKTFEDGLCAPFDFLMSNGFIYLFYFRIPFRMWTWPLEVDDHITGINTYY